MSGDSGKKRRPQEGLVGMSLGPVALAVIDRLRRTEDDLPNRSEMVRRAVYELARRRKVKGVPDGG